MIFDKNLIFTLWIKNPPTILNYQTWKSWIDCGYKVEIYTDDPSLFVDVPKNILQRLELKLLPCFSSNSFNIEKDNILQFSDLWRFMFLYERGGTWLDSDLMLKRRLPFDDIIISSEHTLKAGGRKSICDYRPNIGVLRFPPLHKFTKEIVKIMTPTTKEDINKNVNNTSKMMKFIKEIKKKKWEDIFNKVSKPEVFCPVPYPFAKELVTQHHTNARIKYGLKFNYEDDSTIGLHLWENLILNKHKINLDDTHENSVFNNWCCLKKPLCSV